MKMDKKQQIDLLQEIVEQSYKLLINKISFGGLVLDSKNAFRMELGDALRKSGELYKFNAEDKFNLNVKYSISSSLKKAGIEKLKLHIDIVVEYNDVKAAIKLMLFKKVNAREPNNRCDAFIDLRDLEFYKKHGIDIGFFIVGTDHTHYVNQKSYSLDTGDFDMRDGTEYQAGTELKYKTENPYIKNPIVLEQDYVFKWDRIKNSNLYFLKVKV